MNQQRAQLLLNRLRRLADVQIKGKAFLLPEGAVSRLDVIERRLLEAIRRDETGDTFPDGYPSGKVGSGGEYAPSSSVEAAALGGYRLTQPAFPEQSDATWGNFETDQHHAFTEQATQALERAADAMSDLIEKLDAVDRLAQIPRKDPSGTCQCCERWVEGTENDRLRSGYCEADYKAWVRAGRPDRAQFERERKQSAA